MYIGIYAAFTGAYGTLILFVVGQMTERDVRYDTMTPSPVDYA